MTLAVAKRRGSDATRVAEAALAKTEALKGSLIPGDVGVTVTRNYGETADEKANELLFHLILSILFVTLLIAFSLSWRGALVILISVPITFALTLFTYYIFDYTINRVTLFALILALGLLVDDPITGVDNIERYLRTGRYPRRRSVILAMGENRSALFISTIAIIISFAPLYYITGMMGPYMAPMAFNVPVSVTISTVVAFLVRQ